MKDKLHSFSPGLSPTNPPQPYEVPLSFFSLTGGVFFRGNAFLSFFSFPLLAPSEPSDCIFVCPISNQKYETSRLTPILPRRFIEWFFSFFSPGGPSPSFLRTPDRPPFDFFSSGLCTARGSEEVGFVSGGWLIGFSLDVACNARDSFSFLLRLKTTSLHVFFFFFSCRSYTPEARLSAPDSADIRFLISLTFLALFQTRTFFSGGSERVFDFFPLFFLCSGRPSWEFPCVFVVQAAEPLRPGLSIFVLCCWEGPPPFRVFYKLATSFGLAEVDMSAHPPQKVVPVFFPLLVVWREAFFFCFPPIPPPLCFFQNSFHSPSDALVHS